MNSEENARKAVEKAVVEDGVQVGNMVNGVLFLHKDDIEHMIDLLADYDGSEYEYMIAELRAQLHKQK